METETIERVQETVVVDSINDDSKIIAAFQGAEQFLLSTQEMCAVSLYRIIIAGHALAEKRSQLENCIDVNVVSTWPPSKRFDAWFKATFPTDDPESEKNLIRKAKSWMNVAIYVVNHHYPISSLSHKHLIHTHFGSPTKRIFVSEALACKEGEGDQSIERFQNLVYHEVKGTTYTKLVKAANGKFEGGGDTPKKSRKEIPRLIGNAFQTICHHLTVRPGKNNPKERVFKEPGYQFDIVGKFEAFSMKCPRWFLKKMKIFIDRELSKSDEERAGQGDNC